MDNILSVVAKPLPLLTLQEWSVIKLTTNLSNHRELLSLILDVNSKLQAKYEKEWKDIHSLANKLLSEICVAKKFKEMILKLLWTVSYRIISWKSTYAPAIEKGNLLCFYWTDRGRIDCIRTARYILENKNIPIKDRFKLACSLCLPENIIEIWKEMPRSEKNVLLKNKQDSMRPLLLFWMYMVDRCDCEHRMVRALECSISLRFSEATKYLLSVVPEDIRNDLALLCEDQLRSKVSDMNFIDEGEIEIGYLFFSYMWPSNRLLVLNFNSALTLLLLLHSSESGTFLQEFKSRLSFISLDDIQILLYNLFLNHQLEIKKDHDYFTLFVEVWRIIPASRRNSMMANFHLQMQILSIIIKGEFQHLLTRKYSEEYNSSNLDSITPFCFNEDKWEFLYFLIQEGIVTISSLASHKNVFINFLQEKKTARSFEYLQIKEI